MHLELNWSAGTKNGYVPNKNASKSAYRTEWNCGNAKSVCTIHAKNVKVHLVPNKERVTLRMFGIKKYFPI